MGGPQIIQNQTTLLLKPMVTWGSKKPPYHVTVILPLNNPHLSVQNPRPYVVALGENPQCQG